MHLPQFLDYLNLEKNYSQHTVLAYERDILAFVAFAKATFEKEDISNVHYNEIRNWIIYLVENGISNRTINRKIASLKAYYKFLVKVEHIDTSPLLKHKALKTPKKIQVPFSENEVRSVIENLNEPSDFSTTRDLVVVELLYGTGIRRAELIDLKMGSIDLNQKIIKVLGKRNKERILPLLESTCRAIALYLPLRAELAAQDISAPLLVTQKGVKLYNTLVYRIINRYFSRTSDKIKKSPHIVRHSFATHLLNQGADLAVVKELLGHASLASTQVYTHNSIATLKDVYKNSHPRNKK